MAKISVLGLGYIGLPTAIVLANSGHEVYGYDVNRNVIEKLKSGKIHIVENNLQQEFEKALKCNRFYLSNELKECDIYIIAVPTPFFIDSQEKKADLKYVLSAAREVSKIIKKDDLVILESTVPPGTTSMIQEEISEYSGLSKDDFYTVHCPERVLPGNILYELRNNDRIIGSQSIEGARKAQDIYSSFVHNGEIILTDDITAELSKLVENTFRDINIAFANELSMICHDIGVNVFELIQLANRHPRVNILTPGAGVGGHCLAVDPWFIYEKYPKKANIIKQARLTNEYKPIWISDIVEKSINYDKSLKIVVLGLAYKPNIDDLRESPSVEIAKHLMNKGYNVIGVEPNVDQKDIYGIRNVNFQDALNEGDYFVITLAHTEFIENSKLLEKKKYFDCIGLVRKDGLL